MSILPAIKFKTLTHQLKDDEFDQLATKFRQRIGKEEMLRLMCDKSSYHHLSAMKAEILSMIQERIPTLGNESADSDSSNPTDTASDAQSITNLPSTMIGEIASFLDQKSYARFSSTNRKLFVVCNSPNRLVDLRLDFVKDFSFISLGNYRHLTTLEFAMENIDDFDWRLISRCHSLRKLLINGAFSLSSDKLERFITFMDGQVGAFIGVTTLGLYLFCENTKYDLHATFPTALLKRLLLLFPALTHLKLFNIDFTETVDTALLADCCPSLNRLSLNKVQCPTSFLKAFGTKITTLDLCPVFADFRTPNQDYSRLQRMCFHAMSQNEMNVFLKTSTNLKEISFIPDAVRPMTELEPNRMIKRFIVCSKSIQFFHTSTRGHFENICNSIHQGLFCTSNRGREFMEIALTVDCREITDFNDFICSISQIIVGLTQSETKKWIFSLEANRHRSFLKDRDSWDLAISAFITSHKPLNVELLFVGEWDYVFGSKGCSILETHKHWWNDCRRMHFY